MELSRRDFFTAGAVAAAGVAPVLDADETPALRPGQLSDETLGNLLKAMGLKPAQSEKRYDFQFRSVNDGEEWDLSMTAVLSSDSQSIWVMAWLCDLPKAAADVPRTALLRLLAANDRLGKGKFFAYVASNRRFVLQRVVDNEGISTRSFAEVLKDLGGSVIETYPYWSTANWNSGATSNVAEGGESSLQGAGKTPTRTAAAPIGTKIQ